MAAPTSRRPPAASSLCVDVRDRQHRHVDEDGQVTFIYRLSDIEKSTRTPAFGLLDAVRNWTTYSGAAPDEFQQRIDDLDDRMDSVSVIKE